MLQLSTFQRQKFGVDEVYKLYPEYYVLKVNDFNRWSKVPLEQWLYFLSTSEIPDDADAPGLCEARERLALSRMSRDEQAAYRRYLDDRVILQDNIITARGEGKLEGHAEGLEEGRAEGRAKGLEEGRAEGLEEGRAEANIENARRMKALGIDASVIAQVTGLSVEDI